MLRMFSRPAPLVLALAFFTAIPVVMAMVRTVQIPTGTYPEDSLRLAFAPVPWFLHALAGSVFGLAGPVNFALALKRRFGRLHRLTGMAFLIAGATLGVSGLAMLSRVEQQSTLVIDVARAAFGLALLVALANAFAAIRAGDVLRHRAWAIRAYAIGMGSGTIAFVFLPIYLITGTPPNGLVADTIYVAWWALNIGGAEWVVRRITPSVRRVPA
jgi:Predicted membrane protein (DUF2306)